MKFGAIVVIALILSAIAAHFLLGDPGYVAISFDCNFWTIRTERDRVAGCLSYTDKLGTILVLKSDLIAILGTEEFDVILSAIEFVRWRFILRVV